jgi:hypothetical protein
MLHNTKIKLKHLIMRVKKKKRNKRKEEKKETKGEGEKKCRGWNRWPAVGGWKRSEGLTVGGNVVEDHRFRRCRRSPFLLSSEIVVFVFTAMRVCVWACADPQPAWVWPATSSDDDIFYFFFRSFAPVGLIF